MHPTFIIKVYPVTMKHLLSLRSILTQIERHACVFTFGYGSEHDTDLLHALASAGNGLFYYIDNKDSIPESFCDCLGGLLSVAAQVGPGGLCANK